VHRSTNVLNALALNRSSRLAMQRKGGASAQSRQSAANKKPMPQK
jgi:hypothetical protein